MASFVVDTEESVRIPLSPEKVEHHPLHPSALEVELHGDEMSHEFALNTPEGHHGVFYDVRYPHGRSDGSKEERFWEVVEQLRSGNYRLHLYSSGAMKLQLTALNQEYSSEPNPVV